MLKKAILALAAAAMLAATAGAGLRVPGKYSGIVIFDRWDTCYLYSGVYVMYVSEKTKGRLRGREGQAVTIDAREVSQPTNPGDGLIGKFEFVGPAASRPDSTKVEGLRLTVVPQFAAAGAPRFTVEIENESSRAVGVRTSELAPTLLGEKTELDLFSPSDGKSQAVITRCDFLSASGWRREMNGEAVGPDGRGVPVRRVFEISIEDGRALPDSFVLEAGRTRRFSASVSAPPGGYDFLCGYGGGVHEGKGLVSNIVSFSVGEDGRATLISEKRLGER